MQRPRQGPASTRFVVVIVQLPSQVLLSATLWIGPHQAHLSSPVSWSLLQFIPFESVMLSKHLILYHPPLLLPSIFPRVRSCLYLKC